MCRFLDLKRPSMITLHNIHKSFGQLEVLKGIDLEIHPREMVSIVGSSGAGKTTLLQIMGTLYKPDQGSVEIAGNDVLRLSPAKLARFRCEHLGFVFQFHQLLPEFTAKENILIPGMIAATRARLSAAPSSSSTSWASPTAPTTSPHSSRAAKSSAWPWPAPS